MYVDSIRIENFRTFRHAEIELLHPQRSQSELSELFPIPSVLYPNINLILGNNGSGKSAFLRAVALACLGPVANSIKPERLVRREPGAPSVIKRLLRVRAPDLPSTRSIIKGKFVPNAQDEIDNKSFSSTIRIDREQDYEEIRYLDRSGKATRGEKEWHPIFSEESEALFFVGYGANRRSEDKETLSRSSKGASHARARRVLSLFDEAYSLVPLSLWLPRVQATNKGRFSQVMDLLRAIAGEEHYHMTDRMEGGEYLFERERLLVPFPALSDGYRAFYGWLGDLLYHVTQTAPRGKKLIDNHGIVMIDEIDLHLHPSWQMEVLPRLSRALPNIQFITTTHSPLIVGSLQWVNLVTLQPGDAQSSTLERRQVPVHGLDADQLLVTPLFGLNGTRVPTKAARLRDLRDKARLGDEQASLLMMQEMRTGSEGIAVAEQYTPPPNVAPAVAARTRGKSKARTVAKAGGKSRAAKSGPRKRKAK